MPELPEVETIVRHLAQSGITGARIRKTRVLWPRTVQPATVRQFNHYWSGRRITGIERRGKWIVFRLSRDGVAALHLRMSGRLTADGDTSPGPYDRVVIECHNGRVLHFRDPRKFGRWYTGLKASQTLAALGVEPLSPRFTRRVLAGCLFTHQRMMKSLLLDQSIIAGLGNIYTDECLWRAGIHPCRKSHTLSAGETRRLHAAIRRVLRCAVKAKGTSLGSGLPHYAHADGRTGTYQHQLRVYGRAGEPCPVCGKAIRRTVMAQRGTWICDRCQKVMAE